MTHAWPDGMSGGDADAVCGALAEAIDRDLGSQMSIQALVIQAGID